jgi:hypothetical protein
MSVAIDPKRLETPARSRTQGDRDRLFDKPDEPACRRPNPAAAGFRALGAGPADRKREPEPSDPVYTAFQGQIVLWAVRHASQDRTAFSSARDDNLDRIPVVSAHFVIAGHEFVNPAGVKGLGLTATTDTAAPSGSDYSARGIPKSRRCRRC